MSPVIGRERVQRALTAAAPLVLGRVVRVGAMHLDVAGLDVAIGDEVMVAALGGIVRAEAVSLHGDTAVCMPYGDLSGVRLGDEAVPSGHQPEVRVGWGLRGRVIDGLGRPLDGRPLPDDLMMAALAGQPPHPLARTTIDDPLPLGVRALDTLVPCGRGQRMGIFAGSGVGKSSVMSMIARGTEAEISVVALIGERGREVREFIEGDLGPEGLARSVVVVATSDEPALVRLRAAFTATRIAEWYRDQGAHVLLLMDSLTRFCMAQREIGLAAGEPPATRGYPPSVFALLPKLLERAGAGAVGSITGLYTVLVEADDLNDPIADSTRSILDGHIVLTRRLATAGHFPSIDVLESISRVTPRITSREQRADATTLRQLMAARRDAKDLIEIGAYVAGTNPLVDRAIALDSDISRFLRQGMDERCTATEAWQWLHQLVGEPS